jgi:hypothetical protein
VLVAAGLTEAYNTARFLGHLRGRREALGPLPVSRGSLLVLNDASMMSLPDMAAILALARDHGCKVQAGQPGRDLANRDILQITRSVAGCFMSGWAESWRAPYVSATLL